jgi:alkylation response protein AidB-like acyl-CoA dehydrogenase
VKFGGQGLPHIMATPVEEMWGAANLAFKLCPMLTPGCLRGDRLRRARAAAPEIPAEDGVGRVDRHDEPHRAAGGSDLSLVRTKATPQPDGSYRIKGQKIFITYGEHDYTENIVHLTLARIEGARGREGHLALRRAEIQREADGSVGGRNDVKCVSIEHKLGIHASPTAVLAFGEKDGATGYLVGEPIAASSTCSS